MNPMLDHHNSQPGIIPVAASPSHCSSVGVSPRGATTPVGASPRGATTPVGLSPGRGGPVVRQIMTVNDSPRSNMPTSESQRGGSLPPHESPIREQHQVAPNLPPLFTVEQIELLRRLKASGITGPQVLHAFVAMERLENELGRGGADSGRSGGQPTEEHPVRVNGGGQTYMHPRRLHYQQHQQQQRRQQQQQEEENQQQHQDVDGSVNKNLNNNTLLMSALELKALNGRMTSGGLPVTCIPSAPPMMVGGCGVAAPAYHILQHHLYPPHSPSHITPTSPSQSDSNTSITSPQDYSLARTASLQRSPRLNSQHLNPVFPHPMSPHLSTTTSPHLANMPPHLTTTSSPRLPPHNTGDENGNLAQLLLRGRDQRELDAAAVLTEAIIRRHLGIEAGLTGIKENTMKSNEGINQNIAIKTDQYEDEQELHIDEEIGEEGGVMTIDEQVMIDSGMRSIMESNRNKIKRSQVGSPLINDDISFLDQFYDISDEEINHFLQQGEPSCCASIRDFVMRYNLKQYAIAQMTGISQSYVSRFLKGDGYDMSERSKRSIYRWYLQCTTNPSKLLEMSPNPMKRILSDTGDLVPYKRERFTFKATHLDVLEHYFSKDNYPDAMKREEIAAACNMSVEAPGTPLKEKERVNAQIVANWFANRRKETKKLNKKAQLELVGDLPSPMMSKRARPGGMTVRRTGSVSDDQSSISSERSLTDSPCYPPCVPNTLPPQPPSALAAEFAAVNQSILALVHQHQKALGLSEGDGVDNTKEVDEVEQSSEYGTDSHVESPEEVVAGEKEIPMDMTSSAGGDDKDNIMQTS